MSLGGTLEFILISAASLIVSGLTFYSGFGLGTILMPVFALFFPVEVAVAATAVVHTANSAFKIGLMGKRADRSLVLKFGLPAIIAALAGAAALGGVSHLGLIATYRLGSIRAAITPLKLIMAVLMLVFALFELLPKLRALRFDRKYSVLGGLLSGFFGGFSGHQGALRSAFLVKMGISTEAFVGTSAVIGFMVDVARLAIYAAMFLLARVANPIGPDQWPVILAGILSAFAGVIIGKRFVPTVTMKTVQTLTGILLLGIALAIGSGLV